MATYHTIKCPHCNNIVEHSIGKPNHLGSPFRICSRCGMEYIDTNYREAALLTKKDFILSYPWLAAILRIAVSLIAIIGSIILMVDYGFDFMFLILTLAGVAMLYTPIKQLIVLKKYISLEDEKLNQEIEASKARLSDPEYVIALWKAGAYVTAEILEWAKETIDNFNDKAVPIHSNEE